MIIDIKIEVELEGAARQLAEQSEAELMQQALDAAAEQAKEEVAMASEQAGIPHPRFHASAAGVVDTGEEDITLSPRSEGVARAVESLGIYELSEDAVARIGNKFVGSLLED